MDVLLSAVSGYLLCMVVFFFQQSAICQMRTVVDDADLEKITSCKWGILDHARMVSLSSSTASYLDCDGYQELVKLDNKIIPVLIWDLRKLADTSTIYGKKHYVPYPQSDREWLERARDQRQRGSLSLVPRFIVLQALAATTYGKAAGRTGFDGGDEAYKWLRWWDENKGAFELRFQGAEDFAAMNPDAAHGWPQLSCNMVDGLLDIRADSASVKNIPTSSSRSGTGR